MNLTPEQKQHAVDLIDMGEKLQAVRYLQETLNISLEQAMTLTEKLEEEVEGDASFEQVQSDQKPRSSSVNVGRLVGTIFMIVGVILLGIAGWLYHLKNEFEARAILISGTVDSYTTYEDTDDGHRTTMYTPHFNYEYAGKSYLRPGTVSSSSKDYEIGETVDILIDPDNPDEIQIDSFSEKWLGILILSILGTGFTGMGYLAYRVMSK